MLQQPTPVELLENVATSAVQSSHQNAVNEQTALAQIRWTLLEALVLVW